MINWLAQHWNLLGLLMILACYGGSLGLAYAVQTRESEEWNDTWPRPTCPHCRELAQFWVRTRQRFFLRWAWGEPEQRIYLTCPHDPHRSLYLASTNNISTALTLLMGRYG